MNQRLRLFLFLALLPSLALSKEDKEIPTFGLLLNGGKFFQRFHRKFRHGHCRGAGHELDGFLDCWGRPLVAWITTPSLTNPSPFFPPTPANNLAQTIVQPSDDVALSVNAKWYWWSKYDYVHQTYKWVPYLTGGLGLDLVVDEYPPPPNAYFWSKSFDVLLGMNLGAGLDIPLSDAWILYGEAVDHAIFWQGLTQIVVGRVGIKIMLDSEHVDPFR